MYLDFDQQGDRLYRYLSCAVLMLQCFLHKAICCIPKACVHFHSQIKLNDMNDVY